VVHQSAGALVAALAAAVNDGGGHNLAAVAQGLQSLHEVIGGPGTGLLIDVLQSAGLLEQLVVDGHVVGGHAHGVLIVLAVGALAGVHNSLAGLADVSGGLFGPQVAQVNHQALGAPVGYQTLGTLEDDIGGVLGFDGGGNLIVAVGVVQVLHVDLDVGVLLVELGDEAVHSLLFLPGADGVGPQGDLGGSAGSSAGTGARCS